MIANLGGFIEDRANSLPNELDLPGFLNLAFLISSHDSLAISIPALNLWTKILRSETLGQIDVVQPFTAQLLELATSRLIRVCILFLALKIAKILNTTLLIGDISVRKYGRRQQDSQCSIPQ